MRATRGPKVEKILMNEVDAAAALGLAPVTLARARRQGKVKANKIVNQGRGKGSQVYYDVDYLARWADSNPYFICTPLIREDKAARILGCSVQTVARLRKIGELPFVQKGRFVGYRYENLRQLKEKRERGSRDEFDEYVERNL